MTVIGDALAGDHAALVHRSDLVGQAAAREDHRVGEFAHPQPLVRGFGQEHEDVVVDEGQAVVGAKDVNARARVQKKLEKLLAEA